MTNRVYVAARINGADRESLAAEVQRLRRALFEERATVQLLLAGRYVRPHQVEQARAIARDLQSNPLELAGIPVHVDPDMPPAAWDVTQR